MLCPNCGQNLPEDKQLKFCIFCGASLPVRAEPVPVTFEEPAPEPMPEPAPMPDVPQAPPQPPKPAEPPKAPKAPRKKKGRTPGGAIAAIVILAVLLAAALGGGVYLGYLYTGEQAALAAEEQALQELDAGLNGQIDALSEDLNTANAENAALREQIDALEGDMESLDSEMTEASQELEDRLEAAGIKAELYDALTTDYKGHYFGFGSGNFFVNKAILVDSLSADTHPMLTLNTTWGYGVNVNVDFSSGCARLNFQEESWDVAVNMEMVPYEVGWTVATFTNDSNEETFEVLLIVTE